MDWVKSVLGLDEWQARIEVEVGQCKIQVQDSFRALQSENAFLKKHIEELTELLEKRPATQEPTRRMNLRQEIAERTRLAFEEDAKRKGALNDTNS